MAARHIKAKIAHRFSRTGTDRLRDFLAEKFGLASMMETPPSAMFQRVHPITPEIETALTALERALPQGALIYSNKDLFDADIAPAALRNLHKHDGIGPIPVAAIAPRSMSQAETVARLIRQFGFATELNMLAGDGSDRPVIALLNRELTAAEITRPETGEIRIEPAISWEGLKLHAASIGHRVPQVQLNQRFPTPLAAAKAGLFDAATPTDGVIPEWQLRLSPPSAAIASGLWLFRHEQKALELFETLAKKFRPLFLEFIPYTDLRIAELSGYLPSPLPWQAKHWGGGLRIAFRGTKLTAPLHLFEASLQLEWGGGLQMDSSYLPEWQIRHNALLWSGAAEAQTTKQVQWSDLGQSIAAQKYAGEKIAALNVVLAGNPALLATRLTCVNGLDPHMETAAIYPRSGERADREWLQMRDCLLYPDETAPALEACGDQQEDVESSPEWQAIRRALLDDTGQPKRIAG